MAGDPWMTHGEWQPDHPAQAGFAMSPEWIKWLLALHGANPLQGAGPMLPSDSGAFPQGMPQGGPSQFPYSTDFAALRARR